MAARRAAALELTRRLPDVTSDDEDLAHAPVGESGQELAQVGAVGHEAGGQMRHQPVP
jgi:hypothetical protein